MLKPQLSDSSSRRLAARGDRGKVVLRQPAPLRRWFFPSCGPAAGSRCHEALGWVLDGAAGGLGSALDRFSVGLGRRASDLALAAVDVVSYEERELLKRWREIRPEARSHLLSFLQSL